jgi:hypothetical protein
MLRMHEEGNSVVVNWDSMDSSQDTQQQHWHR